MTDTMTTDVDVALSAAQEARVEQLHRDTIVIDGSVVLKAESAQLDRTAHGGLDAVNHTVMHPDADFRGALHEVSQCRRWLSDNSARARLTESVADLEDAKRTGRLGVILGPQNSSFLEQDLTNLETFYQLGVRIIQLTYQRQNYAGAGCGEARDSGVSLFGRELIREMDRMGVLIDLSHCGNVTSADAVEISTNPVVFSHAHPAVLNSHIRSKPDDVIRALADKGGTIGITSFTPFLRPREGNGPAWPTLGDMITHIGYLCDLVGVDHVTIGTDIDETISPEEYLVAREKYPEVYGEMGFLERRAKGVASLADFKNITRALVGAGYSDDEVSKLIGGNLLRVLRSVWR